MNKDASLSLEVLDHLSDVEDCLLGDLILIIAINLTNHNHQRFLPKNLAIAR